MTTKTLLASSLLLGLIGCTTDEAVDSNESAIINGDEVNPTGTGLVRLDTEISICSSTLLDNTTLLTAAHCLDSYMDHTYGGDGHVQLAESGWLDGADIAIDAQGRSVIVGATAQQFYVVRLRQDGSFDTTFGNGGKVLTDFANASFDSAKAVAIDGFGRILVAGQGYINNKLSVMLARYNTNGTLDTAFSGNGLAQTYVASEIEMHVTDVALDSSGRIYIVGAGANNPTGGDTVNHSLIMRYTTTGSLDTSFAGDGMRFDDFFSAADGFTAVTVDSSGRPVAVGGSGWYAYLVRYTTSGALDTSFNGSGKRTVRYDGDSLTRLDAVVIDHAGRIVVGGYSEGDAGMLFGRFTSAGAFDTSFAGGTGWVLARSETTPVPASANDVKIDSLGRIYGAGLAWRDGTMNASIVRLTSAGLNDRTFDTDGVISFYSYDTNNSPAQAAAFGLGIDPGNNLLVGEALDGRIGVSRIIANHLDRQAAPDVRAIMGSQERTATRVIRHPSLDVAIVKLASPMWMNLSTTGYRSNPLYSEPPSTLVGKTLDCYGYGIDTLAGDGAGVLRTADLKVISQTWSEIRIGVNSRGQELNSGDSGGPCFYNDGTRWTIAGITSKGTDQYSDQIAASVVANWVATTK